MESARARTRQWVWRHTEGKVTSRVRPLAFVAAASSRRRASRTARMRECSFTRTHSKMNGLCVQINIVSASSCRHSYFYRVRTRAQTKIKNPQDWRERHLTYCGHTLQRQVLRNAFCRYMCAYEYMDAPVFECVRLSVRVRA
eukprot:584091-Pleurochrysis_carterae.AAC.2